MATELSPEQQQAISARPEGPVEIIDPTTKRTYVLVSAEAYAALLADDSNSAQVMEALLAELSPEDWEDAAIYEGPRNS